MAGKEYHWPQWGHMPISGPVTVPKGRGYANWLIVPKGMGYANWLIGWDMLIGHTPESCVQLWSWEGHQLVQTTPPWWGEVSFPRRAKVLFSGDGYIENQRTDVHCRWIPCEKQTWKGHCSVDEGASASRLQSPNARSFSRRKTEVKACLCF